MRRLGVLGICLLLLFTGCLKDDDETVLLPIPASKILGIDLPEDFENHFHVNEGSNPPDVFGRFLATPMVVEYASDGYFNPEFYDLSFEFSHLYGRNTTMYGERQHSSSGRGTNAQVIGSGNDFTVFFYSELQDQIEQWKCKTATIISGTLLSNGISNFQYANIMIEKDDPLGKIMEVGQYHIFHDEDGFVEMNGGGAL